MTAGIKKKISTHGCGKIRRSEDKKKIYQMGLDKMKSLKDTILYKHVLIKNTLKDIQKNNKDMINISDTLEDSDNEADLTFHAIEELLKEIDLATTNSLKQKRNNIERRSEVDNDIMEDFHANEAMGKTRVILDEDPSSLFDL